LWCVTVGPDVDVGTYGERKRSPGTAKIVSAGIVDSVAKKSAAAIPCDSPDCRAVVIASHLADFIVMTRRDARN
jgi:hypothetical protein